MALLKAAKRAWGRSIEILNGCKDALRQRAIVDQFGDVVTLRCSAQVVWDEHADVHGLPYRRGCQRGALGAVRNVCKEEQI